MRGDQLRAGRALEHRAVIPHAQDHIGALRTAAAEEAVDQIEFGQGHV